MRCGGCFTTSCLIADVIVAALSLCERDFVFIHYDADRSLTILIADRGTRARIVWRQ